MARIDHDYGVKMQRSERHGCTNAVVVLFLAIFAWREREKPRVLLSAESPGTEQGDKSKTVCEKILSVKMQLMQTEWLIT